MPRRNENADYHRPKSQFHGRIFPVFLPISESPIQHKQRPTGIKTTDEDIVRNFRKAEGLNFYEDMKSMRPLFRPPRRPFFLKRWINAVHSMGHTLLHGINWERVFELGCIGAVVGCLIYLGIFVFAPFTAKLLR